jgi:hypothetical protein
VPETDPALRFELLAAAWQAGQHELVNSLIGELPVPQLIDAVKQLHSDGALAVLSADANRDLYLAAITDEQMARSARLQAIIDVTALEDPLAADSKAALIGAAKGKDCAVAATAAHVLAQAGDRRFVPVKPHARNAAQALHALCVAVSYGQLLRADEPSLLPGFVPHRGLDIVTNTESPVGLQPVPVDLPEGQLIHTVDTVPPNEVAIPEADDLVRAFDHCTGTTCTSDSHEFKLTFDRAGLLSKIEMTDLPACHEPE